MLKRIDQPQGLDLAIDNLMVDLESSLFPKWGKAPGDPAFVICPRCQRNPTPAPGTGEIAEVYTGDGEYQEIFKDDVGSGLAFFGESSKMTFEPGAWSAELHLVIFANVKELYPDLNRYADYDIRADFARYFEGTPFGFTLGSIEIGLKTVLREYNGSRRDDRLAFASMAPWHVFRLNLTVKYDPDQCF